MYLQQEFPRHSVDAEYNRDASTPKRLELPNDCANYRNEHGESLVVPDVIVHRRGPPGPNVLVEEVRKTTNPCPHDCDHAPIHAFRDQYEYEFAALIECETRPGHAPAARVEEWLGE